MATFLQIVQKVSVLSGTQGTVASVTTAGFHSTLAAIVQQAWLDIQNLRSDWLFMRNNVTINTTIGKTDYSVSDIFGAGADDVVSSWRVIFDPDLATLTELSNDEYIIKDVANLGQHKPTHFTYDQQDSTLKINPPDNVYTLDAHYLRKPQLLENNTDEPVCPDQFTDVITYRALVDLGAYLGSNDLFQSFLTRSNSLLGDLMRSQLPAKKVRTRGIV